VLTLFRRHVRNCNFFGKSRLARGNRNCKLKCPIHVEGSLRGESVRKGLDLTSWEAASDLIAQWNASGEIGVVKPEIPTVKEAVKKFFEDAHARQLKPPTIKKLKNLLETRLLRWCEDRGFQLLKQLDVDALRQFQASWNDGALSAQKNIERLRGFFRFCCDAGWMQKNHAKALKPPKAAGLSERVKVFTADEIKKILKACDRYPTLNAFGYDNPERVRAFVLALRYTGLRIGDCIGLKRSHLEGDRLFLRTLKTGAQVYVPIPKELEGQLEMIESGSEYFFWTGNGKRDSAVSVWERTLRRLFALASVKGNPHMYRHTFATDLLIRGVPIEDVAILLGHSSPVITAKYYAHFVKARRERLEQRVRALWM
jgi:integrase